MRPEEVRALGDLAGGAAAGIAALARDVHAGIADRVFDRLGTSAAPVRFVHDQISAGAYGAARALTGTLVRSGALAYSLTRPVEAPSVWEGARGRAVVGALNGAWGDQLHQRRSALETPMALRRSGQRRIGRPHADLGDVPLDPVALARAFPDAGGRLAVFIHGLGETDETWRRHAAQVTPYGDRLATELGYTPLFIRYNSGRHISHNGRQLSELLDELIANWPVAVGEIALIGHSMGGLLARSACHYAPAGSWRGRVRDIFMLGSPHRGAPLELAANAACHAMSRLPETRPFAVPIKLRSAGVKDLGYGYVVDEDWAGHDPDALWTNTATEVPWLPSANHYFIAATLSRDPGHPVGRLIGDLLVLRSSAWSQTSRGERPRFEIDHYRHLGAASHFDLLNHPAVYEQIRRWLSTGRELTAGPAVGCVAAAEGGVGRLGA